MDKLEERITENINPYFEKIFHRNKEEVIKMRAEVKETRKKKFVFHKRVQKTYQKIEFSLYCQISQSYFED